MNRLLKIALVGSPNVGKSALFNRLCKKRISVVDEEEGVTRDRIYARGDYFGHPFCLIDTGGIDPSSKRDFNEEVQRQTDIALQEADRLLMVVDSTVGPSQLDRDIAKRLRKENKRVVLAINKIDHPSLLYHIYQFQELGIENMVGVSAIHGFQIEELLEKILEEIDWTEFSESPITSMKLAIIGRTNVGKSTLLNALIEEERCLVSPVAGTTRDMIEVDRSIGGNAYHLIDTPGLRKRNKEQNVIDKFATLRTYSAIVDADICLLVFDATEGVTSYEKKIATMIEEKKKGALFLFNKWDLVSHIRMEHCLTAIKEQLPSFDRYPMLFISAKKRDHLEQIFEVVKQIKQSMEKRIPTPELNKFIKQCQQAYHPPSIGGKRLRIYYLAQIGIQPPEFVLFVNHTSLITQSYKRYIINRFYKEFSFVGTPLLFHFRGKKGMI